MAKKTSLDLLSETILNSGLVSSVYEGISVDSKIIHEKSNTLLSFNESLGDYAFYVVDSIQPEMYPASSVSTGIEFNLSVDVYLFLNRNDRMTCLDILVSHISNAPLRLRFREMEINPYTIFKQHSTTDLTPNVKHRCILKVSLSLFQSTLADVCETCRKIPSCN